MLHSLSDRMKHLLAFANIPSREARMFEESLADHSKFEAPAQRMALRLLQCTLQPSRVAKKAEMFKESITDPGKFVQGKLQEYY